VKWRGERIGLGKRWGSHVYDVKGDLSMIPPRLRIGDTQEDENSTKQISCDFGSDVAALCFYELLSGPFATMAQRLGTNKRPLLPATV
jgi:hypothetical protein